MDYSLLVVIHHHCIYLTSVVFQCKVICFVVVGLKKGQMEALWLIVKRELGGYESDGRVFVRFE